MDKNEKVFAFIDSQNLNLGVKSQGWSLDFKKFRLYLKNKLKKIICPNLKYSSLLKDYRGSIHVLNNSVRPKLEDIKKDQNRRSVETLGLSDHDDASSVSKKALKVKNACKSIERKRDKNGKN